jgi:hypothetical protein
MFHQHEPMPKADYDYRETYEDSTGWAAVGLFVMFVLGALMLYVAGDPRAPQQHAAQAPSAQTR